MSFKANASSNYAGVSISTLEPAIYEKGSIIGIGKGTKEYNEVVTPTINITLANKDGAKHTAMEKCPEDPDKFGSYFDKMLHILSSFLPAKEFVKAVKVELNTFEELQDFMIEMFNKHYPEGHKVDFKIEAGLMNGNMYTRLPNFNTKIGIPIIKASGNSEIIIKFSNRELKGLQDYNAKKRAIEEGKSNSDAPDMGGNAGGNGAAGDPGF
jgi:hypothetical protein